MNLYGFAGGDPVNHSDPFGLSPDTLQIVGEDLKKSVAEERAKNPAADKVFRALEESTLNFLMVDKGSFDCESSCPFLGFSYGGKGSGDLPVPAAMLRLLPSAAGAAHVDVQRALRGGENPGKIAWHEAVHLTGIVNTGAKYRHCSAAFNGVPAGCPR